MRGNTDKKVDLKYTMNIKLKAALKTGAIVSGFTIASLLIAFAPQVFASIILAVIVGAMIHAIYTSVLDDMQAREEREKSNTNR